MLTGDLVRYHVVDDEVQPRYILRRRAEKYLDVCSQLIYIFKKHKGKTRGDLITALEEFEGKRTDFKILRGLAKLLEEKAEFSPTEEIDFPDLRHCIFSLAQTQYPIVSKSDLLHHNRRNQIFSDVAKEFRLKESKMNALMYGDLPENQILKSFETYYSPETLLKRYNLALAQGLLYKAIRMRITLAGDYRIVFQHIKLSRLIHWIKPYEDRGYEILLNGPASIFCNTQRYGIRMANFLPGLLLARRWKMTADIQTRQGPKRFHLDSDSGLSSHYTHRESFDSRIEQTFFTKFSRQKRDWTIEREGDIIDLGDAVFIPDFTFRHDDGRTAHLEIVGFWTPEYLKEKMDKIRRAKKGNLILAVNKQLNCSREDFKEEIIFYRTGIKIGDILQKLEIVGC